MIQNNLIVYRTNVEEGEALEECQRLSAEKCGRISIFYRLKNIKKKVKSFYKQLEEKVIRLRKLKEKDAKYMLEWMHDLEIQKNFQFDAENKRKEDVLIFIREARDRPVDGESIHYAVVDESDEYLGTISLKNINIIARNAEYAISLRRKAQGRGIATIATEEILRRAFCEFGLERVYLNVLEENRRAIHLYERCGFVYEGEFRKHLFLEGEFRTLKWYSMLKEEYMGKIELGGISKTYISNLPVIVSIFQCGVCSREEA